MRQDRYGRQRTHATQPTASVYYLPCPEWPRISQKGYRKLPDNRLRRATRVAHPRCGAAALLHVPRGMARNWLAVPAVFRRDCPDGRELRPPSGPARLDSGCRNTAFSYVVCRVSDADCCGDRAAFARPDLVQIRWW